MLQTRFIAYLLSKALIQKTINIFNHQAENIRPGSPNILGDTLTSYTLNRHLNYCLCSKITWWDSSHPRDGHLMWLIQDSEPLFKLGTYKSTSDCWERPPFKALPILQHTIRQFMDLYPMLSKPNSTYISFLEAKFESQLPHKGYPASSPMAIYAKLSPFCWF